MATELQQMIDVVAKDKGIDPSIVVGAIEDAYLAAARKVFKEEEDLRTRFNLDTGLVELYAVKQIVEAVADPHREIALADAQAEYGEEAEAGMEIEFPRKPTNSAALPRRRPSRSSPSGCAKRNARRSTANSASASAKW